MDWLRQNGFWVLILIVFVAAHLFGHGGHGGHGGRGESKPRGPDSGDETRRPGPHQH